MLRQHFLLVIAAATLTSAALIVPTSGLAAHDGWHGVFRDGQAQVMGSGRAATESRSIGNFRALELNGIGDVELRLGSAPTLQITADDNLLPYFTTRVEGDTLVIDSRGSFRTQRSPRIVVTVPDVESVVTKGSGDVRVYNVNNARLSLVTRGSGDMSAQGRTRDLVVTIQGSGDSDVRGLASSSATASVQGSGDIRVTTNGALNASVAGSGTIYYAGSPQPLHVHTAGSGDVIASR